MVTHIPERGDLVWLDFSPQSGHEQAGKRPALIISPASYNGRSGLAFVCPITGRKKGYPFEVNLPESLMPRITGTILADQVKSCDWKARNAALIGRLDTNTMREVQGKIRALMGI